MDIYIIPINFIYHNFYKNIILIIKIIFSINKYE